MSTLGVFSTLGDTMSTSGAYHESIGGVQYIEGCSVHRGVFSTLGGAQYIRGCSVHRGDVMGTLRVFSSLGGYHEYFGVFNRNRKAFVTLLPRCIHDIPPMYLCYPPNVLNNPPPMYSWYPPMY